MFLFPLKRRVKPVLPAPMSVICRRSLWVKLLTSFIVLLVAVSMLSPLMVLAANYGFPDSMSPLLVRSVYCSAWLPLGDKYTGNFTVPAAPGNKLKGGLLLDGPLALQSGHEYLFVVTLYTTSTFPADSLPNSVQLRNQGTMQPNVVSPQSSFHSAQYSVATGKQYYFSYRFTPETDIAFEQPVLDMSGHVIDLGNPGSVDYVHLFAVDVTASGGSVDLTPIIEAIQASSDLNHSDLSALLSAYQDLASFLKGQFSYNVFLPDVMQKRYTLFDWLGAIWSILTGSENVTGGDVDDANSNLAGAGSSQSAAESDVNSSLSGAASEFGASAAVSGAASALDDLPSDSVRSIYSSSAWGQFNAFLYIWILIPLALMLAALALGVLR